MEFLKKVNEGMEKVDKGYMDLTWKLTVLMMGVTSVANASVTLQAASGSSNTGMGNVVWPWEKFIYSLAEQLSGPLPRILGVLGIVGAAVALFAGNGGAGTQKFIMLIFAISIALFAPTFINWLDSKSATGATVADVFDTVEVTAVADSVGQFLQ